MRKEVFCEILGDIDETYVKEAGVGRRAKKSGWMFNRAVWWQK